MNLLTISIRNMRRKMLRTTLLVAVFCLGILSVVTLNLVSRAVGESLEEKLNEFGANILIYPKTETLSVSYGGFSLGDLSYKVSYLDEAEVESSVRGIEFDENISAVAPKLVEMTEVDGTAVAVVGVQWEEEQKIKSYWDVRGEWPGTDGAIVGAVAADRLGLEQGSVIPVGSSEVTVAGILASTGSDDDNLIFVSLPYLQEATDNIGRANFVEVSALCAGCPIDDIVAQISAKLPNTDIRALQQVVKQRMYTVMFVKTLAFSVSMIILLTACVMMALFMFASVNERKKEVGIFRAFGYSRLTVFVIFCFDAMVIGILAGVIGYLGGYAASAKVMNVLALESASLPALSFTWLGITTLGVALLSIVSAAFPALKATRVDPAGVLVSL